MLSYKKKSRVYMKLLCVGIGQSVQQLTTGWTTERSSSNPGSVKNLLSSTLWKPALGPTQSPLQWVTGSFPQGVNRPGPEAYYSPPTSAEVKKKYLSVLPLPHVVTRRASFTFIFSLLHMKLLRIVFA
jgi:hypothetical protein